MYSTIASAIRMKLESHFTNRAVLFFKNWDDVLSAEAMRDQAKLWILCRLGNRVAWIWHNKTTRATKHRVSMTNEALVSVMSRSQTVRVCAQLGKRWI
jgi:hypothetical protein